MYFAIKGKVVLEKQMKEMLYQMCKACVILDFEVVGKGGILVPKLF